MKRGAAPAKPHTDKQKTKPTAPTKRREKKIKKRDWREDFFCVAAPQPKGPIFPMKKKQSQKRVQWRRGTAGSAKRRETAAQEAKGGPLCMRRRWAGSTSFASFFLPQYLCAGCGEQPKGAPRHRRKKTLSLLVGVGAIARRGHWEQKKGDGVCGKKKRMECETCPRRMVAPATKRQIPYLRSFFFRNTCH